MKIFQLALATLLISSCSLKDKEQQSSIAPPYKEKYRPQFHFSPDSMWMNDPNGMVYHNGEYHLFYQYYPDSTVWGPMHWGHVISKDLISWEHLPIAIYPDSLGYIFSGSAVLDQSNSSGLGSPENPPLVAIFTYHDPIGAEQGKIDYQTQGIAYSNDNGRSWSKYEKNPVLENPGIIDFRDPKVFWNEETQNWIMILAVKDHVNFYSSTNLIDWSLESEWGHSIGAHGGVWECPDLFELETPDGERKWVMLLSINPGGPQGGSATQYFVGDFDGSEFIPSDSIERWVDYGADNYAGVTWSNIPEADGRRLFIGWMSNWQYAQVVPTTKWRSAMTLPRSLSLFKDKDGYRVQSKPVRELIQYRMDTIGITQNTYTADSMLGEFELELDALPFIMTLKNSLGEELIVKITEQELSIDRRNSGITSFEEGFAAEHQLKLNGIIPKKLNVFLDASSIEVFLNEGQYVLTDIFFSEDPLNQIEITNNKDATFYPFASIWQQYEL